MNEERSYPVQVVEKTRKAYSKPVLTKVHLLAEEAVLATCKFGTGSTSRNQCLAAGDLSCTSSPRS